MTDNKSEAAELRAALEIIAEWRLPESGHFWDLEEKTRPMDYESAYGSNGARDFIRNVARVALSSPAPVVAEPPMVDSIKGYDEWRTETLAHDDGHGGYVGPMEAWRAGRRLLWAQIAATPLAAPVGPTAPTINGKAPEALAVLDALIDIYDDAKNNPPEHRQYVESAWSDIIEESRKLLAAPLASARQ